jgi:dihydroorotate dehydrogenase (NAD+) catalytic subunit
LTTESAVRRGRILKEQGADIIELGGIQNTADAIEFMMAGSTAVAVGTANFYEPQTALQVITGLREFMQRRGIKDVREITGSVQTTK